MHWGVAAWLKYVKVSGSSGTQFRNCKRGGSEIDGYIAGGAGGVEKACV
jgi:hypothetical protein